MNTVRSASHWRMVLLLLAGLAVMLQAAIPAGFMPGMGKQAGSFITICSTFGEKTVFVADDAAGEHDERADSCAYAFTLPAADNASAVVSAYVTAFIGYTSHAPSSFHVHPTRIDLSRPPTGPPAIV